MTRLEVTRIACLRCGGRVPPGPYCDTCGAPMGKACPSCAAENRPEARFCAGCGAPFEVADGGPAPAGSDPSDAQHKQITILFADICDSTRLISRLDAEEASHALGPVIQVIGDVMRRFGGVVSKHLGDGIMALFGAPVAAEDHAARACLAALAALGEVGRMGALSVPVRVGLCSGPVVLRRTGRDDEDYDVTGITAHVAARLEQQAAPGTILLAHQTARLVAGVADVEAIGDVALRGLAGPVQVFRLIGATDRSSWAVRSGARALSTFVGREEELAQLSCILKRAWEGQAQAAALVADAGMGKSRLVHEVLGHLERGAWRVMRVEPTALSAAIPYFLVNALLRELTGCAQEEDAGEVAARLPAALSALGPGVQANIAPLLVHLDREADDAGPGSSNPAERRRQLLQALIPILGRCAELTALILVVEDYHWLDASSADLLDELFRGLGAGARAALLLTTRPERRPGWPRASGRRDDDQTRSRQIEIELGCLTRDQADRILGELIGGFDELAALRARVVAQAEGTPFFLEEFARSLHESGAIAGADPGFADIVIPASVQGILAARMDRLPPLHRRLLQVAAVIGRDIPARLLGAVAGVHGPTLAQALTTLCAAGFLTELGPAGAAAHRFAHALTQSVAYDTLLRRDRRALHGLVLRALEAQDPDHLDGAVDQLAHHALAAEAWPEAARYAVAAGERATRRAAWTEAKAYLETAIVTLSRQPASVADLMLGIDARLALRGIFAALDSSKVQEHLHQWLMEANTLAERAGDPTGLARVYITRGTMLSHWGDLPGAAGLSRAALDIMLASGDPVGIVGAAFALAQALWYSGDLAEARNVLATNAFHARSEQGQGRSAATFVLPAAVFFCYRARVEGDLGDDAAAFAAMGEARSIARRLGEAFDRVLVDAHEGALLLAAGRHVEATDVLECALRAARANKIEWHIPLVARELGLAYVETGRHGDARELLEAACASADRSRHVGKRLLCGPPLVRALAEAPDPDLAAAKSLAARTLQEATARGFRPIAVQTRIALARVLSLSGEREGARASLKEAVALSKQLGLAREEAKARKRLACLLRHGGVTGPALAET